MIEIKGTELQQITGALGKIINKPIQFKLAYRLTKFANKLQSVFKDIEKQRVTLVEKYGVEDKEKKTFSVPKEKLEEFHKEFDLVLEKDISLDIEPIPQELLISAGIEISAAELASIEQFIEKEK